MLVLNSCSYEALSDIPFYGMEAGLLAHSKEAKSGVLTSALAKPLFFSLESPERVPAGYGLAVSYNVSLEAGGGTLPSWEESCYVVLRIGEAAWVLPLSADFLGRPEPPSVIRYTVPLSAGEFSGFSIGIEEKDSAQAAGGGRSSAGPVFSFAIQSLELEPTWYGFAFSDGELAATPFVFRDGKSLVIDVPARYMLEGNYEVCLDGLSGSGLIDGGGGRFEYRPPVADDSGFFSLPSAVLPATPFPLAFSGESLPLSFKLRKTSGRAFPLEPVVADPGIILNYPQSAWRYEDYEVFQWDRFPELLIFDTKDYEIQSRFFKRLAFFTEKAGYRGRLIRDEEIAGLHGWNAHDYRAEDLALFFNLARGQNFPLTQEEITLEKIILAHNILRRDGNRLEAGEGGIISISRESAGYLRIQFLVHEAFHGVFFIDRDFRELCFYRWKQLDAPSRRFLLAYLEFSAYDAADEYLVVNEFMAYCLQQPVSAVPRYFGEVLPARLASSERRQSALPGGDTEGPWPVLGEAFRKEAAALSSYVENRFGLSAGRVGRVYSISSQ